MVVLHNITLLQYFNNCARYALEYVLSFALAFVVEQRSQCARFCLQPRNPMPQIDDQSKLTMSKIQPNQLNPSIHPSIRLANESNFEWCNNAMKWVILHVQHVLHQ